MLKSGASVAGFEIVHVLGGETGMGVVYEAADPDGDERVALKVFPGELSERPAFRRRFRDEVPRQAAVDHPRVVQIYQAGNSDQGLYVAMRLVRGPNLRELIPRRGLEPDRALAILTPIAEALDTMHEDGLLHHDLKPEKILVHAGDRDEAFLTGFGIGHLSVGSELPAARREGALYYVSPEEIRGETPSGASEVYAFAAIVFEALTGVPPFAGRSERGVLDAHLQEPPPRASAQRSQLPARVDRALARALAKEPGDRPQSAGELMHEVERGLREDAAEKSIATAERADAEASPIATAERADAEASPIATAEPAGDAEASPIATAERAGDAEASSIATAEHGEVAEANASATAKREAAGSDGRSGRFRRAVTVLSRRRPTRHLGAVLALVALTAIAVAAGWLVSDRMRSGGERAGESASAAGTAPPRTGADAKPAPSAGKSEPDVLDQAMRRLNDRRQTLRARLAAARTPEGQGAVCASLARAYEGAVDALVAPTLDAQQRQANAGVVAALERTSDAYGRMASAAVVGDRAAFARTGREVQRLEESVSTAVGQRSPAGGSGAAPAPPS